MNPSEKPAAKQHIDFWVLLAAILAPSMVFMVSTALTVALPAIQRDLGASGTDLIWIVNAYTLLQAAFLFISGTFGDHYGRRRIYAIGILLYALAALICGIADSSALLIAARLLQGIGSGMTITCSLAILADYYGDDRRGWAIGIWSAFTILMGGSGPIIGGWLAEAGLWRWIFIVNLPLCLITLLVLMRYVPESYDEDAPAELDISGTFLSTAALMLSGFFAIEGPRRGFSDPSVLLSGIAAIAILPIFLWIEGHSDHPMLPLNLFRSRTFSGANSITLLLYGAMNGVLFFLPLSLIQVQGYSESAVGFALLPMTTLMVLISFFMNHVVNLYGLRPPLVIGPLLISLSFVIFAGLDVSSGQDTYWRTLFLPICLFGIGMGTTLAPLTTAVMASVDHHHSGIASGLNNTVSRSAQVLVIAIMGGVVLVLFDQALLTDPIVTALPSAARDHLAAESLNLAETSLPADLSALQQADVSGVIRSSFAQSISAVMWIAAGLSFISAIFALFVIEKESPAGTEAKIV